MAAATRCTIFTPANSIDINRFGFVTTVGAFHDQVDWTAVILCVCVCACAFACACACARVCLTYARQTKYDYRKMYIVPRNTPATEIRQLRRCRVTALKTYRTEKHSSISLIYKFYCLASGKNATGQSSS